MATTKYIVNNVSGQTINGQSFVPPYKVYTALLNQSGGDDPQTTTGGTLTIGVTYEITNIVTGDDFTNVGAPSNDNGVKFVATNTTPNVWTNSSELSYNNGTPVVTVLENTLSGSPVWSYDYVGNYSATLINEFTVGKTCVILGKNTTLSSAVLNQADVVADTWFSGSDQIYVNTFDLSNFLDSVLNKQLIEIRVYN